MARTGFAWVLVVLLPVAAVTAQASTTTYAVGTCKPTLRTFSTISAALSATPAPAVVDVCPGTYTEQIQITQSVTLQGVISGNGGQAIIAVPAGGLATNAVSLLGDLAAQVWVNNSAGPVNITNITFDGSGNGAAFGYVVGVFYQNSSGTVNRITARNYSRGTGSYSGIGVLLEGGVSDPTVTVENSSIHDFDLEGIVAETTGAGESQLNATIKSNYITFGSNFIGIVVYDGSTSNVTGNWVNGTAAGSGIQALTGALGTVSSNNVFGAYEGILTEADGVEVTNNKIVGSAHAGLAVTTSVGKVHANTLMGGPAGVEAECRSGANVFANIINDAGTGVVDVLDGVPTVNSYFNVGTIRSIGFCTP